MTRTASAPPTLRANTANWPHNALINGAEIELGRGEFDAARAHREAALSTVREDERGLLCYDPVVVELALWAGRWKDADEVVREGLERARARDAALIPGPALRPGPPRAGGARDAGSRRWRRRPAPRTPRASARSAHRRSAGGRGGRGRHAERGRLARPAEAEYARARGEMLPDAWSEAAGSWERLERPPLAAYCRWRQAEALAAAYGDPSVPLRDAHAVAARIGGDRCCESWSCSPTARGSNSFTADRQSLPLRGCFGHSVHQEHDAAR